MSRPELLTIRHFVFAILAILFLSGTARAQDHLCDPGNEDCRDILIRTIRAEQVGIDVAFWFMEDNWYADELIKKWQAGVPVRLIVDSRANGTYTKNGPILDKLRAAGIPMRERFTGGILHWKMMLFDGQDIVQFSGANYSEDAWGPLAQPLYSNYVDEAILFTGKDSITNSFRTKYDDLWLNTTYYRNYANITSPPTRRYGTFAIDPELNFAPWEPYAPRAVARYNQEQQKIDVTMYRITDRRHTDAIIAAVNRGIPVRLISEPKQYRDETRLWHAWNTDRLYMAGVQIKHRKHAGLNHQKTVILYGQQMTINGSSNWTSPSSEDQEEHNLFTTEPWMFQWFVDQFERKWNNSTGVEETEDFVPLPPAQPKSPIPSTGATAVEPTSVTLQWEGGYFAHVYDVYLGTTSNPPLIASDLPLGPSLWATHHQSLTLQTNLVPGTLYYWKVVGKTMANQTATSPVWTFTTSGTAPPPPPPVNVVRGPYLQQVTPTSAIVVWATADAGVGQVRATAGSSTVTATAATTRYAATTTGLAADYYQHEATLTGLTAATTYNYDILVGGEDANPQADTFTTAPSAGSGTVTFVAIGDSGTGSTEQRQIASLIDAQWFDLMLHGGDIAYGNSGGTGDGSYQTLNDWFFSIYRNSLRGKPVFPSVGNHDSRASNLDGKHYLDMFVLPRNGGNGSYPDHAERYYSFDYGPLHVVVLDTELAFQDLNRRAAQLAWLDADLSSTSQPWKIAVFHRSPFSAGGEHGSDLDVRAAFAPVFERQGVQAVFSAHEHTYERTKPWRVTTDPSGSPVTYIVTGGGGAPLYPSGTDTWTAVSASRHHYVRGTATLCALTVEAVGTDASVFDSVTLNRCSGSDTVDPTVSITAPAPGATVSGNVTVTANASDNVGVIRTELLVDGVSVAQDTSAPYSFTWSTTTTSNGSHDLIVRAFDAAGNDADSGTVTVTVANPTTGGDDIVLYASTATVTSGGWRREEDPSAAGGFRMRHPNGGAPKRTTALASPVDYFEVTFEAEANVPYHLWVRSKADNDDWANDSVFIQFSGATDYAIGTTSAAEMNLEDCSGCGLSGWGWQDNGWGIGVAGPHIVFTTSGPHTIRVQTREDGLSIDQIMLSPSQFLTQSPGALKNDTTIYPQSSDTTGDTQPPATAITSPTNGATVTGTTAVTATASDDVGVARVELWVDGALALTDNTSPYSFSWNTATVANGNRTLQTRAYDAAGNVGQSTSITVTVNNGPAPDTQSPATSISSPAAGATVSGTTSVAATATDNVGVTRVELWVDGALALTDNSSPYTFSWNTTTVANGNHTLQSRAYDAANNVGQSTTITVTVSNTTGGGGDDIVLYAANATRIVGAWRREADPTAAGGMLLHQPNLNAPKLTSASANPSDYFELTFTPEPNVPYHLWARIRAEDDYWPNESVYIQFSSGTPYTIGTTSATDINLENCSGCGVSGWGWQDNGWGAQVDGVNITFTTGGEKTIRVQTREDGAYIDQIILSPARFLTQAPGPLKNDATIYPESGGTTGDTQAPTTAITSPSTGATVTGTTTVTATATDNVGVTRVELWVDGALALTDNSSPYSFSWNTATVANGNHTLQSRAYDAANNVGQSTTLTVTVNNTSSGPKEIVLYAADATVIVGRWRREEDPTAAGGMLMHHPNQSAPKITSPSASPTDYFELTFTAEANVPYHLWARIKAENNDWPNESVYIQFSSGTPYTIGTTTAADINLENCSGCGVSGWGWQDNGWGAQVDGPNITFSAGGVKTIRVQTREDGTYIDQIVLSPGTYLTSAPGPLKNDNTILPKQ